MFRNPQRMDHDWNILVLPGCLASYTANPPIEMDLLKNRNLYLVGGFPP